MTEKELSLKASLVKTVDDWINKRAEKDELPKFWIHDSLSNEMGEAAFQVMIASVRGQEYKEENE